MQREQLQQLLDAVARAVVNDGHTLEHALARAAQDRGISLRQLRPSRAELTRAIADYRELFRPQQLARLESRRRLALDAMRSLAEFSPRLTGGLVHGDGPLDRIRLLVYSDSTEQVLMHLHDRGIPWQDAEVELHFSGERRRRLPAVRFVAGDTRVELLVLDRRCLSDPPRDSIDGGRLPTLDRDELAALLGGEARSAADQRSSTDT